MNNLRSKTNGGAALLPFVFQLKKSKKQMRRKREFGKILKQTLLLNLAAATISVGISFGAGGGAAQIWRSVVYSLIYSNSIGALIAATVFFAAPLLASQSNSIRLIKHLAAISAAALAGVFFANAIIGATGLSARGAAAFPSLVNFAVATVIVALVFGFGIYLYEYSQAELAAAKEALRQKELTAARTQSLASEAQLASLEARIHPHFLFNTLNSIAALINENPALAEKTVEKLAKLLRYSLDANARSLVTLEQELKITEDYLQIEKVRFGERLNYKIGNADGSADVRLPPLALQTLVENSIKHVAAKTSEKTEITISNRQIGDSLEITVADNGAGFDETAIAENHGLDNLRKRLQTIFGEHGRLEIAAAPAGGGCVRLKIPLKEIKPLIDTDF